MGEPTPEAYEAAARAYCLNRFDYPRNAYVSDEAHADHIAVDTSSTAGEQWLRDLVDAAHSIVEAQVRAKVAAEIRALNPIDYPTGMRCRPWWNSLGGPRPFALIEWAARIAEGKGDET